MVRVMVRVCVCVCNGYAYNPIQFNGYAYNPIQFSMEYMDINMNRRARRIVAGLSAVFQICFALFVIMLFADPFVNTLESVAVQLSLPPFLVACIIPIVSNLNEVIASIEWTRKKEQGKKQQQRVTGEAA